MALGFAVALRNSQNDQITTRMDAGSGAGLLRIYDGTRPATGGTATNLLAQLTLSKPSAAASSNGTLTFNSITGASSAAASGTATWFRIVQSDGTTHVMDGSVTATGGGGDMQLNSTAITAGGTVNITSFTITSANS